MSWMNEMHNILSTLYAKIELMSYTWSDHYNFQNLDQKFYFYIIQQSADVYYNM